MDYLFAILGFKTSPPEKRNITQKPTTPTAGSHTLAQQEQQQLQRVQQQLVNELQRSMANQQQQQQTFNSGTIVTSVTTSSMPSFIKAQNTPEVRSSVSQSPLTIPTQKEVFIGYRAWIMNPTDLTLHPVAWKDKYRFEPLKRMEAICHTSGYPVHKGNLAPLKNCECGIYAFKDLKTLLSKDNYPYKSHYLIGRVALWGKVIEHENGYRAQYAYPQLFFKCPEAKRFANAWGVEIDSMPIELQKSVDKVVWHEEMLPYHKKWNEHIAKVKAERDKKEASGIVYENGIPILVDVAKITSEYNKLAQQWIDWEQKGKPL